VKPNDAQLLLKIKMMKQIGLQVFIKNKPENHLQASYFKAALL